MLSKAQIKLIRSLEQKKYRDRHKLFIAEGDKIVHELLDSSLIVECVFAKKAWLAQISEHLNSKTPKIVEIDDRELSQISFLKTPNQAMALVQIPQHSLDMAEITGGLSLYLDSVQDPGNLGTIIRLADWFGIRNVLCGENCADLFNPKTVQSTMGAVIRVKIHQTGIDFFRQLRTYDRDFPVYGTFLNGENIYNTQLSPKALIVMGNESKGIGNDVAQYITSRLLIPSYPIDKQTSESLNVATAAAIVCAEFRRKEICRSWL